MKLYEELRNKNGIAAILGEIGSVYLGQADYPKALAYYFRALKMTEELGNKNVIAVHLGNIGNVYYNQADYPKALDYSFKALKLDEELGNKDGVARQLGNIGSIYSKIKKYKEAEEYLKKSLALSEQLGALEYIKDQQEYYSILDSMRGNYKGALEHYKKAMVLKDTLFSQENKKQLVRKEVNYEFEKKEAATKAEQEKKDGIVEEEKRTQKIFLFSVIGGLLFVVVFAGFIFRSLRITRKQKHIIELQKGVVEKQKQLVEDHQKEIVDSINYARRIQFALLASDGLLKNNLPEHFVLFKPKDVVSGDFYWASPIDAGFIYITADCTGHGVPGAFMSLLNISKLSQTINENKIIRPDLILNNVRTDIINALNPKGSTEESKDGMDAILCKLDVKNMKLQFAAANNSFYIIRNNEIVVCKADKMPVGKGYDDSLSFTFNEIDLQKGDVIYTFTDGYADQFGGPKGKKFKYKQLEDKLLEICDKPMAEQKTFLDTTIEKWKGDLEQVDDILIIGIRV